MARISLDPPRTVAYRLAAWVSTKMVGAEMDPGKAMGHNTRVLLSTGMFEGAIDRFTPLERQVMAYAEAMCATPDEVTDEMVAELDAALGTKALVELTMMVAVENQRSRFNSAMGLTSQGFQDRCELSSAASSPAGARSA